MLGINGMAQWVKCPLNKAGTQVCLTPNKLEGELNHKGVLFTSAHALWHARVWIHTKRIKVWGWRDE